MATDKVQIGLRVPDDLREKIQAAANARGVPVNREISDRLEKSFNEGMTISAADSDNGLYAILRVVATAMEWTGPTSAFTATRSFDAMKQWLGNAFAYDQAVKAAMTVLEAFRPPADPKLSGIDNTLGEGFAATALEEGATGQTRTPSDPAAVRRAKRLHGDLGPLADRIQKFNQLTKVATKKGKQR